MVNIRTDRDARANNLSVLALSSRFDGLCLVRLDAGGTFSFSTRSVESF